MCLSAKWLINHTQYAQYWQVESGDVIHRLKKTKPKCANVDGNSTQPYLVKIAI